MAIDKKEFEKELILSEKGAEVLKERIDKVEELEKRINKLETLILKQDVIIKIHTDHFKKIADSLESNLSIIKENDERFRKHINNLDAHKE